MYINGITFELAEKIAEELGIRIKNTAQQKMYGKYFQCRLFPLPKSDKFRKLSSSCLDDTRRCNAVCWHGHYYFMLGIFHVNPNAVIKTCKITYHGVMDFQAKYHDTMYESRLGMMQLPYVECCDC